MAPEWLQQLRPGEVVGVRCHQPQAFAVSFATEFVGSFLDTAGDLPRLVTLSVRELSDQARLLETLVSGLAEAALLLWPDWYAGCAPLHSDDDAAWSRIHELGRASLRGRVDRRWFRAARQLCRCGRPPLVARATPTMHVRQLSACLRTSAVHILVALTEIPASLQDLDRLARVAEWLAREADAAVLLAVPESLADQPGLAPLIFFPEVPTARRADSLRATVVSEQTGPAAAMDSPPDDFADGCTVRLGGRTVVSVAELTEIAEHGIAEQKHLVQPVIGRPHPASPGEQRLSAVLANDGELAGLFQFNQPVHTVRGSRFLVDLLWKAGRVVVEVDGYSHHASQRSFVSDRHRDYELLISGYVVLRLTHSEAAVDPLLAMEKIRDVVRYRTTERCSHAGRT